MLHPTRRGDEDIIMIEGHRQSVRLRAGGIMLAGDLAVPVQPRGVVLFAHGSGSSRMSPRNRYVAGTLFEAGLATLLMDLLTEEEEDVDARSGELRFDIELLAERVVGTIQWLMHYAPTATLPVGLFGASTGAAAALVAAAESPGEVAAVVSRGGRPDLAGPALAHVQAPTLLIVGELDDLVLALNRQALAVLRCDKALEIVPDATHLFTEPGTLEQAASLARGWFQDHLAPLPLAPIAS